MTPESEEKGGLGLSSTFEHKYISSLSQIVSLDLVAFTQNLLFSSRLYVSRISALEYSECAPFILKSILPLVFPSCLGPALPPLVELCPTDEPSAPPRDTVVPLPAPHLVTASLGLTKASLGLGGVAGGIEATLLSWAFVNTLLIRSLPEEALDTVY